MAVDKIPVTAAVRVLRQHGAQFTDHRYDYQQRGGTAASSSALGVPEHVVIKTLVMEDDTKRPLLVLMHGDHEVSTKTLARLLQVKSVVPCAPEVASRHSGYVVGGTSPFGTRKAMPVFMQESIASLPRIYINGGARGYLVGIAPDVLITILRPRLVNVAV